MQQGLFTLNLKEIKAIRPKMPDDCEECLKIGGDWVHRRLCETCGHVGCCNNSRNRHATKHFHSTNHPIIKLLERGEEWGYCYPDDLFYESLPQARKELTKDY